VSGPPSESGENRAGAAHRVARNSAWLVGGPLALNVLSIASTGYIARKLGAEGFATFSIGIAFALMFAPLTNMGLRALTVRYVAQHRNESRQHLGTVLTLRLVLALFAIGVVLLATPLGSPDPATRLVATIAAGTLLLNTIVGVLTDGYHAIERMGPPARAGIVGGLVLTIASVVAAGLGGGPSALAATYLLGPMVTGVYLWVGAARAGIQPQLTWAPAEFRRLLKEALPFFGQGLVESISSRLDLVILGHTLGNANLGGYTAARQLAARASVVVDGSGTALLPSLAHLRTTDPDRAPLLLRGTLRWMLAVTLPLAVATALAAPEIIRLVFGAGFESGSTVLGLQIFVLPFTAMAVALGHALFVVHRNRQVVSTSITSTTVTTAAVIPGTLLLGTIGAPIANLIGRILLVALRLPAARTEFPGLWTAAETRRLLFISLATAIPFVAARLAGGGLPLLSAAGALALGCWTLLVWRFHMLPAPLLRRFRIPTPPGEPVPE
jgi:O-antigen/teichoic acid export membrane protein